MYVGVGGAGLLAGSFVGPRVGFSAARYLVGPVLDTCFAKTGIHLTKPRVPTAE